MTSTAAAAGPAQADAVNLFSGADGWGEGLQQLGMRAVGLELDPDAVRTSHAAGYLAVRCDVTQYPTAPFAHHRGNIASPPCQAWSRAGKGLGLLDQHLVHQAVEDLAHGRDTRTGIRAACRDPRSILAAEPMRWHHDLRPEWIAMEEVPDVLPLWQQYAQVLRGWGYSVWCGILNAANFGVPQTRRRAILIASRVRDAAPPAATHTGTGDGDDLFGGTYLPWVSMAQALDLPAGMTINTRGERRTSGGNNFSADGPSWALTEKARSWWVLRQGKRSNSTVRRLDEPAATLVAGHSRRDYEWITVGDGPVERRQLTIPEAAQLQSFPADYPWHGSESKAFLQIANAVPPLLAAHVVSAATRIPLHTARPAALATA